jgi:nucleoid DNA-binding protein
MSTFTTKRTLNFDESLFMNFSSETLKGRISQAGEKIKINGKNFVKFKPGKTLRNKI